MCLAFFFLLTISIGLENCVFLLLFEFHLLFPFSSFAVPLYRSQSEQRKFLLKIPSTTPLYPLFVVGAFWHNRKWRIIGVRGICFLLLLFLAKGGKLRFPFLLFLFNKFTMHNFKCWVNI